MKILVILLIVVGLMGLGVLYIKKKFRTFMARMIDPRQFMQNEANPGTGADMPDTGFGKPFRKRSSALNDQEVYNKDGIKIMKGEARK
jgi:hypothetical protein